MKISFKFYTIKDLQNMSIAKEFVEILHTCGLTINKAGDHEPIKTDFELNHLLEIWKGNGSIGEYSSCDFLFKRIKEIKFSGMVAWHINIHPNSMALNAILLWLNIPKNYNIDKLIKLGDDLFVWSEAAYGCISEESREQSRNIHEGLEGIMWVNYFGSPYTKEPDFRIPNLHIPIGNGVKVVLAETPDDEKLSSAAYLDNIKREIGIEWFWAKQRNYKIRVPLLDKSQITRAM